MSAARGLLARAAALARRPLPSALLVPAIKRPALSAPHTQPPPTFASTSAPHHARSSIRPDAGRANNAAAAAASAAEPAAGPQDELGAGSLRRALAGARARVAEALRVADAPGLRRRLAEREEAAAAPELWESGGSGGGSNSGGGGNSGAQALLSEVASLRSAAAALASFEASVEDAVFALELLEADGAADGAAASSEQAELVREALAGLGDLSARLAAWELRALLRGPHDSLGAHVTITAGAGGADAMDWAAMLERMYTRWASARGFRVTVEDRIAGEEAGVKTVEMAFEGELAYGWLRGERGTHRLVRASPFNAKGLRQTSFAGVEVVPLLHPSAASAAGGNGAGALSPANALVIPERELEWSFQRCGGKGGQNVNKVESGVRLAHLPTGLAVKATQERSQQANRAIALARLKAKLLAALEDQRASELALLRGDAVRASWGMQVRSYVLMPYQQVKDLRCGWATADAAGFLDGGRSLDEAMAAVLKGAAAEGAREANSNSGSGPHEQALMIALPPPLAT